MFHLHVYENSLVATIHLILNVTFHSPSGNTLLVTDFNHGFVDLHLFFILSFIIKLPTEEENLLGQDSEK